jgi:cytochrome c
VWGPVPMPAQTLGDADAKAIAAWLAAGAGK